jgi:hypothetical protein
MLTALSLPRKGDMLPDEILLKKAHPTIMIDLGYGVLNTAMVETVAYCLNNW